MRRSPTHFQRARFKQRFLSWLGSVLLRALGWTLRINIKDEAEYFSGTGGRQHIFAFWHNRMLLMPLICERHNRNPKGAVVLTSPSRDGAILEEFMKHFGVPSVRGSSSRRGATALLELTKYLEEGKDVVITPDGPRGPRYRLGQGLIFLAQKADCPIMPIHVEYLTLRSITRVGWIHDPPPLHARGHHVQTVILGAARAIRRGVRRRSLRA